MKDVLIVFARFPEVGKCKTRLIPALGPKGAAELQQAMTTHTLHWGRKLARCDQIQLQVRFAGGSHQSMQEMFGDGAEYLSQSEGDLGIRLQDAFEHCEQNGARKLVVIGTDCPEVDDKVVRRALQALESHEVCLCPALDGGYTLLGIQTGNPRRQQLYQALFHGISWGTDQVLSQTVHQLNSLGARVCLLPTLSDVDLPEDLEVWNRVTNGQAQSLPKVSVIVPVFGSEPNLDRVLQAVAQEQDAECIVVATGEEPDALALAADARSQLYVGPANRSLQMNLGAARARSDILLFLHADTLLPDGYLEAIQQLLQDPDCVGGAFQLRIDSPRILARIVESAVHFRSRVLRMPYGDQGIFVRRSVFERLGGFRDQPIMEDYDFVRRLGQTGRLAICELPATTSPRRWHRLGFLRTTLVNQLVIAGYHLGISTEKLATFYRRPR